MTQQPPQAPNNPATVPTNPVAPVVQAPAPVVQPQTVAPQPQYVAPAAPAAAPVAPAAPIQAQNVQVAPPVMPKQPEAISNWDGIAGQQPISFMLVGETTAFYKFQRLNETGMLNKEGLPTRQSNRFSDALLINGFSISKQYWGTQTPAVGTIIKLSLSH